MYRFLLLSSDWEDKVFNLWILIWFFFINLLIDWFLGIWIILEVWFMKFLVKLWICIRCGNSFIEYFVFLVKVGFFVMDKCEIKNYFIYVDKYFYLFYLNLGVYFYKWELNIKIVVILLFVGC